MTKIFSIVMILGFLGGCQKPTSSDLKVFYERYTGDQTTGSETSSNASRISPIISLDDFAGSFGVSAAP